jgi:hypothetical protein
MTINWIETDLDSTAYQGFHPLIILSKLDAFTLNNLPRLLKCLTEKIRLLPKGTL